MNIQYKVKENHPPSLSFRWMNGERSKMQGREEDRGFGKKGDGEKEEDKEEIKIRGGGGRIMESAKVKNK